MPDSNAAGSSAPASPLGTPQDSSEKVDLAEWVKGGTVRLVSDPVRVQVLRLPRCGDCGHRHVAARGSTCKVAIARLCSCCPSTWPQPSDVAAVIGGNGEPQ